MAARDDDKSLLDQIRELWQLVLAYFKQETVGPVRNLGRFVAFGVAGSLVLGLGLILLLLGALRLLQTETGAHFQGNSSWVPYLIVLGGAVFLIVVTMVGLSKSRPSGGKEETS